MAPTGSPPVRHRLEATFDQRGIDCIAAAGADPEQTDRLLVDEGQRYKKVDRAANVLDPRRGVLLFGRIEIWFDRANRTGAAVPHIMSCCVAASGTQGPQFLSRL